jgi:hypothetical protein
MNNTLVKKSNIKIKFIPSYENVRIINITMKDGVVSLHFKFDNVKMKRRFKNRYVDVWIKGEITRHTLESDIVSKDPQKYLGEILFNGISSIMDEKGNEYAKEDSIKDKKALTRKLSTFYTEIEILD